MMHMDPESHAKLLEMENVSRKMKFWFRGMFISLGLTIIPPGLLIIAAVMRFNKTMAPGPGHGRLEADVGQLADAMRVLHLAVLSGIGVGVIGFVLIVFSFVRFLLARRRLRELGGISRAGD